MSSLKTDIKTCQEYAVNKDGQLLTDIYTNNRTKMKWKHNSCGHIWEARWDDIRSGKWCPACYGKNKPDIQECYDLAISKNGLCLETVYINDHSLMTWKHNFCGQEWKATWQNIHKPNGTWCPKCNGKNKPNIEVCKQWAISKQGLLLSTEYINATTKLLWQCDKLHTWKATWHNIKDSNTWCSICNTFRTEIECIKIAENILGISLVKKRIKYKDNNIQYKLEFDGYNEEHKIAVEYNGKQHYEQVKLFHKTNQDFIIQQERDERKRKYCKENNITLIEIPYYENKNMSQFILKAKQILHIKTH